MQDLSVKKILFFVGCFLILIFCIVIYKRFIDTPKIKEENKEQKSIIKEKSHCEVGLNDSFPKFPQNQSNILASSKDFKLLKNINEQNNSQQTIDFDQDEDNAVETTQAEIKQIIKDIDQTLKNDVAGEAGAAGEADVADSIVDDVPNSASQEILDQDVKDVDISNLSGHNQQDQLLKSLQSNPSNKNSLSEEDNNHEDHDNNREDNNHEDHDNNYEDNRDNEIDQQIEYKPQDKIQEVESLKKQINKMPKNKIIQTYIKENLKSKFKNLKVQQLRDIVIKHVSEQIQQQ